MDEQLSREFANPSANRVAAAGPSSETRPQIQTQRSSKTRARVVQIVAIVVLLGLLIFLWRFLGDKAATKTPAGGRGEVVPVEVAAATQQDIPIQLKSIGNVEPLSTIAVRSQVEGTLQRVGFVPGAEVKKDQVLFQIDPRPLQATLNQAEANLLKAMAAVRQGNDIVAKDEATANNDRTIAKRDANLLEAGVVPREQYDNDMAKLAADEATVRADQSAVANLQAAQKAEQSNVENAQVQLSYATIRAPISGKTGNLAVTAGNLVRANDTTAMVTITQAAPIYVTFSVPETDLIRIRQYSGSSGFSVQAVIPGDESNSVMGKLSLVDNTVDVTTGTVRLKATFQNDDRRLYPGQFLNVVLTLGFQRQAIVVPSQAVQIGQDKSFLYVVKSDSTVEARTVKTGPTVENMTVIDEGLQPGEQVVTDGQLRLVPGSKVQEKGKGQGGNQNQNGQQSGQGVPAQPEQSGSGRKRGGGGEATQSQ